MNILLVNDDGIYSNGLFVLWKYLSAEHNVTVVAPLFEQSAVSHSISIYKPVRISLINRSQGFEGYAVEGTPADCVKTAFSPTIPHPEYDCIVSGINKGYNTATNILYSGTVSAAAEGYFVNIPAIAVSTETNASCLDDIALFIKGYINYWKESDFFHKKLIMNINYPNRSKDEIQGLRFTRQGTSYYKTSLDERTDTMGRKYYWFSGEFMQDTDIESDDGAISEGYISVSPLKFDLTDYSMLATLKEHEGKIWQRLTF